MAKCDICGKGVTFGMYQIFARVVVLFTSMPVHEYAHGWMAHKLGDDTAYQQGRDHQQDHRQIPAVLRNRVFPFGGQEVGKDVKAIKRGDRQQVEDRQPHIDRDHHAEDFSDDPERHGDRGAGCDYRDRKELVDNHDNERQQQIGSRAGQRGQRDTGAHRNIPVEPVGLYRNRPCPAKPGEKQQDRAERVEMGERVQVEAASTVDDRLYALYIGLPSSVGASVRMGNLDSERSKIP